MSSSPNLVTSGSLDVTGTSSSRRFTCHTLHGQISSGQSTVCQVKAVLDLPLNLAPLRPRCVYNIFCASGMEGQHRQPSAASEEGTIPFSKSVKVYMPKPAQR